MNDGLESVEPSLWEKLTDLANSNHDYFSKHQDESGLRISAAHIVILDILKEIRPLYQEIEVIAPEFDFDERTPGNGYRSFLFLIERSLLHSINICQQIGAQKTSMLFRKTNYMKEVEACSQLLGSLCTFLHHLKTLYEWSKPTDDGKLSLFPADEHSPEELLNRAENIDQYCFFGRCLAFQFVDSLKYTLKTILLSMASFSEIYFRSGSLINRCSNTLKYILDPEARARRIVNISQRADVSFCKSFWLLNETNLVQFVPFMMIPSLSINQVISIPPEELTIPGLDGSAVSIPIPTSHTGKKPIHVKLLSAKRRIGMVGSARGSGELYGPSDVLLFHCHGGGFVAQSSKAHEVYLRDWAVSLDVPLISVDYSLAPEAPFPRALEEILYSYAWALKHSSSMLGTTAKKIIFIGDSAGANLNLGLTKKCFELNIKIPDGIFMAYVPVLVEFVPSPSRMLGLTDPMLPFGFMMRCLKAYTIGDGKLSKKNSEAALESLKSDTESFAEVSESDLIALALSPNGDELNEHKLASLPSDSTLNSVSLADVDIPQTSDVRNESASQEYIRKFLNLYNNSSFKRLTSPTNPDNHYDSSSNSKSFSFFGLAFGGEDHLRDLDLDMPKSPTEEFVFTVPRDPLLSPYHIPDETLKKFPPVKILSTNLDPCLDDCVMFARKLKILGNSISLDIVSGLPHGFLSFSVLCKEAHEGSELCVKRIQELISM